MDVLTSHADLLPTMLGLAGLDPAALQQTLAKTHDEVHPLVSRGSHQVSELGFQYASVVQPCHVETVIARLPTGPQGALEKWKYSRTDTPQFWSDPSTPQDVVTLVQGPVDAPGTKVATTTVKTTRVPDQFEAYNLAQDPLELDNLASSADPDVQAILATLQSLLEQQCQTKRLLPSSGTVPGQLSCPNI